jgi:hypothetical protein
MLPGMAIAIVSAGRLAAAVLAISVAGCTASVRSAPGAQVEIRVNGTARVLWEAK